MGVFVWRELLIFYLRQNEFWFRKWFCKKHKFILDFSSFLITWIRRWYLNARVLQIKIKNKLWGLYSFSFFKMSPEMLALKKLASEACGIPIRVLCIPHFPCSFIVILNLPLPHPSASLSIPNLWADFLRSYFPGICLECGLPKSNTLQESSMFMRAVDGLEVSLWLTGWGN